MVFWPISSTHLSLWDTAIHWVCIFKVISFLHLICFIPWGELLPNKGFIKHGLLQVGNHLISSIWVDLLIIISTVSGGKAPRASLIYLNNHQYYKAFCSHSTYNAQAGLVSVHSSLLYAFSVDLLIVSIHTKEKTQNTKFELHVDINGWMDISLLKPFPIKHTKKKVTYTAQN